MSCGLAIFVKTPALSPVKSRLWPGIGRRYAEALYLTSAEAVASVARECSSDDSLTAYWAVAESSAMDTDDWADLPHIAQGEGGLGDRMANVYAAILNQHGSAILIGADAPQITVNHLLQARQWLMTEQTRYVIGRADDGGFWLFGGNSPIDRKVWRKPQYSHHDTAVRFIQAIGNQGQWLELSGLRDIDTAEDIVHVLADLQALSDPTTEQRQLTEWLLQLPHKLGVLA